MVIEANPKVAEALIAKMFPCRGPVAIVRAIAHSPPAGRELLGKFSERIRAQRAD
jgi:hypothetical protein